MDSQDLALFCWSARARSWVFDSYLFNVSGLQFCTSVKQESLYPPHKSEAVFGKVTVPSGSSVTLGVAPSLLQRSLRLQACVTC